MSAGCGTNAKAPKAKQRRKAQKTKYEAGVNRFDSWSLALGVLFGVWHLDQITGLSPALPKDMS
jgi:hypothetical protein